MPRVKVLLVQEYYQIVGKHVLEIELPGEEATVRDVIGKLPEAVRERLLDENGEIRYPAMVAVNGRRIEFLAGLDTKVRKGDTILVSPRALFVV